MAETSLNITSVPPTWETKKNKRRNKVTNNKKGTPKSAVLIVIGRRGGLKK